MKNTANIITISRIFIAVWLIFTKPLSPCFYVLYTVCGLTDMIDGTVARIVWVIAALLAVISAGEELIMNMKLKQFEPDRKSIITLRSVD